MITKINIRLFILITSLFLIISAYTQVPVGRKRMAPSTPPAGKVIFASGANLYVYDTTAKSKQVIATNTPLVSSITWGGGKVAYMTAGTVSNIFVVPIDGSSGAVDTGKLGYGPAISPDGNSIAFVEYPGPNLVIIGTDGTVKQTIPIINLSQTKLQWVPGSSNKEISYINTNGTIEKYNITTSTTTTYTLHTDINTDNTPSDFFWKPDGTAFIYADNRNSTYIYNLASATNTLLANDAASLAMVKWQPDGSTASYQIYSGLKRYNDLTSTFPTNIMLASTANTGYDWVNDSNNFIYTDLSTKLNIYNLTTGTSTVLQENSLAGGLIDVMGVTFPQWIPVIPATPAITSSSPTTAYDNQGMINITVNGRNLPTNPQIKMTASINTYTASTIVSSSDAQIVFQINVNSMVPNIYSIDIYDSTGTLVTTKADGLTLSHANQPPTFTPNPIPDIVVNEDSGAYSFNVTISPGGTLDAGQTLQVIPSADNTSIIGSVVITPTDPTVLNKVITITPAANKSGIANFSVKIKDNGGVLNGGVDTTTATFKYTVNPVNDPPSFDVIPNTTVSDSTAKTIIINNVITGPTDETTQTLLFTATSSVSTFLPDPTIIKNTTTGNWEMVLSPMVVAAITTAKVTITAQDNGGTANGGFDSFVSSFNFTVDPKNVTPKFNTIPDTTIFEDAPLDITVLGLTAGNSAEDIAQTLTLAVTSSNTTIINPAISRITGGFRITGTPAINTNGLIFLAVTVKDNGGVLNGAIDTFTQNFNLNITPVNDPPKFDAIPDTTVPDSLQKTIILSNVITGPTDEVSQTLTFNALSDLPAFLPNPIMSKNTLTGNWEIVLNPTLVAVRTSAKVTITAQDNGGAINGGINSFDSSFNFTVDPKNVTPKFNTIPDTTILEDAPLDITVLGLTAGNSAEDIAQTLTLTVTSSNTGIINPTISRITGGFKITGTPALNTNSPVILTVTVKDNGGVLNGAIDTYSQIFNLNITPVNDPPKFDTIPDTNAFDSTPKTIILTNVITGPADESTQTLTLRATSNTTTFLPDPTITKNTTTGNWEMVLSPLVVAAITTAKVTITAQDNGGVANGGVDSLVSSFNFTVDPKNVAPKFNTIPDTTILEDAPLDITVLGLTAGNSAEDISQTLTLTVTSNNTGIINPTISRITGGFKITGTPVLNVNGPVVLTVTAKDNGGVLNGAIDTFTQNFNLNITPVNDPPKFDIIPDTSASDSTQKTIVLTNVITGPVNEASQTITFIATSSNQPFLPDPLISKNLITGNWELILSPRVVAALTTSKITIFQQDNGGTANSGVDAFVSSFNFAVDPKNTTPKFNTIPDTTIFEDTPLDITVLGLTAGNSSEDITQTLTLTVMSSNTGIIIPTMSRITGGFKITGTPAININGALTLTVTVQDNGGVLNGAVDTYSQIFNLNITPVNDPPKFDAVPNTTVPDNLQKTIILSNVITGPTDEVSQTLTFNAVSDLPAFLPNPTISKNTLTGNWEILLSPALVAVRTTAKVTITSQDNGGTANGGINSFVSSFNFIVDPINIAPKFNTIPDTTILEDRPLDINVSGLTAGNSLEDNIQTTTVTISSSDTGIISPTITQTTGGFRIIGTPVLNTNGTVVLTVTAKDTGGTLNGGIDTYSKTFNLNITPVNDPPKFDIIPDTTILEDAPLDITVLGLTAGNSAEDIAQTLTLTVTSNNTGIINPTISRITGGFKITGTPALNANGPVILTVSLKDNGGVLNGAIDTFTQNFNLNITPVNDPPKFDVIPDTSASDSTQKTIVLTNVIAGPADEASQPITFIATSSNQVFLPDPLISKNLITGNWELILSPRVVTALTTSKITIIQQDNGGTANSGIDAFVSSFTFTVDPKNVTPKFNTIPNTTILEDVPLDITVLGLTAGNSLEDIIQTTTVTISSSDTGIISPTITQSTGGFRIIGTPVSNTNGTVILTVTAKDTGGTLNGGIDTYSQTFNLNITPVNDLPTAVIPTILPVSGDGIVHSFTISGLSTGPANESTQTINSITATTDTTSLLNNLRVEGTGNSRIIYYYPVDKQAGNGNLIITIQDTGGTLNGGIDTKTYNVPIPIISKPGIPTFISPVNGDYTSGDDTITFTGTATSSNVKYRIYKESTLYQTRSNPWIEIVNTPFYTSGERISVGIPTENILTSGEWYLMIAAEDERGGITLSDSITVNVPTIMPPAIAENSLILFGMPINSPNTIKQLPSTIKLATYNTSANNYLTSTTPFDSTFNPQYSYWIKSTSVNTKFKFTGSVTTTSKSIPLSIGWNLIPNPYLADIKWSVNNIEIYDTLSDTTKTLKNASDIILPYAWTFVSNNTEARLGHYSLIYDNSILPGINNTIPVWGGLWVKALKECEITIPIPTTTPPGLMTRSPKRNLINGWSTRIIASSDKGASEVVIGVCDSARNLSLATPPASILGSAVKIASTRNGNQLSADFVKNDDNKEWSIIVSKDDETVNNVMLSWPDLSSLGGTQSINLTDLSTGKKISLNEIRNYSINFANGETSRTIKLSIGKRTASSLQITNVRTENNRGSGQVKFDLSSPAIVTMTIRNLVGQMITCATLDALSTGSQTINWNTEGKSAGKYIIEIKAADKDGRSIRATSFISIK